MAQWVEPGHAMRLTTDALVLEVVDHGDDIVSVTVTHAPGAALVEPVVSLAEGGFRIDLEARVPAEAGVL